MWSDICRFFTLPQSPSSFGRIVIWLNVAAPILAAETKPVIKYEKAFSPRSKTQKQRKHDLRKNKRMSRRGNGGRGILRDSSVAQFVTRVKEVGDSSPWFLCILIEFSDCLCVSLDMPIPLSLPSSQLYGLSSTYLHNCVHKALHKQNSLYANILFIVSV